MSLLGCHCYTCVILLIHMYPVQSPRTHVIVDDCAENRKKSIIKMIQPNMSIY